MKEKLRRFKYTCDFCHATAVIESVDKDALPENWGVKEARLNDGWRHSYNAVFHACPTCNSKALHVDTTTNTVSVE